jgi:D-glycero-D-manno-heptose 1,7-bisphosphate phosphatase
VSSRRPAVLLDRDGTLVPFRHYPDHPDHMALLPEIGAPLRALRAKGYALVVVTNQSGLARGLFTARTLSLLHDRMKANLAVEGVALDAIHHCPHHPHGVVPALSISCTCRKPEPGLLLRAAADLDLDLSRSWMVGDTASDAEAGRRAGCRTASIHPSAPPWPATTWAPTTAAALTAVLDQHQGPCG